MWICIPLVKQNCMSSLTQSIDRLLTAWSDSVLLHRHHATANILAIGNQITQIVRCSMCLRMTASTNSDLPTSQWCNAWNWSTFGWWKYGRNLWDISLKWADFGGASAVSLIRTGWEFGLSIGLDKSISFSLGVAEFTQYTCNVIVICHSYCRDGESTSY